MFECMYNLASEGYKSNLCKGFTKLQHCQEFVDVTLVAEGHLVKAHQNIIALASPYLKEILQNVPCQHPVVFFNNIDHKTLTYLLEYIYTGEVQIPSNIIQSFIMAAKEMHITGIQQLIVPQNIEPIKPPTTGEETCTRYSGAKNKSSATFSYVNDTAYNVAEISTTQYDQPGTNAYTTIGCDTNLDLNDEPELLDFEDIVPKQILQNVTDSMDATQDNTEADNINIQSDIVNTNCNLQITNPLNDQEKEKLMNTIEIHDLTAIAKPLYCKSIRGNLQMIFNRFLYNMHHQSDHGHKRRWRCIEYRKLQCLAYIDTIDENIVNRKFQHTHPYHDKKILVHGQRKRIFTSINEKIGGRQCPKLSGNAENNPEKEIIFDLKIISPGISNEYTDNLDA